MGTLPVNLETSDGRLKTIDQWADETGIPAQTIYKRVFYLGWTVDRAVSTPIRRYRAWNRVGEWYPGKETRAEAYKRIRREGRKDEFDVKRQEILAKWCMKGIYTKRKKNKPKIDKRALFFETLSFFPPLE